MAQTQTTATAIARPPLTAFSWNKAVIAIGALMVFAVMDNVYERLYALSKGLDYTSPDYEKYWMGMFYAELVLEAITAALFWGWLWVTRDRALDRLAPAEELKRYWHLGLFILTYTWGVYAGASYFTEQDGTWHQTVIRDTDFTPSHIIEFYQSYPIYIIFGVGSLIYAMTRLPVYSTSISLSYAVLVGSPMMIFPNVGLNEFGHTRWFMEELFVAPLHWGFVAFGWGALALFGVLLQFCPRALGLINHVYHGKPIPSAAEVMKNPERACDTSACMQCAM